MHAFLPAVIHREMEPNFPSFQELHISVCMFDMLILSPLFFINVPLYSGIFRAIIISYNPNV